VAIQFCVLSAPLLSLAFDGAAGRPFVQAQTSYGTAAGTVSDSTGATVLGATVTLKNERTDVTEVTTTGGSGTCSFLNLNPGS
jgi:hypothetical protein